MIEPIALRPGDLGRYLLPELIKESEKESLKEWVERGRVSESDVERKRGYKLPKGEMVCNEKRGETVRERKTRRAAEGERGDAIKKRENERSLF